MGRRRDVIEDMAAASGDSTDGESVASQEFEGAHLPDDFIDDEIEVDDAPSLHTRIDNERDASALPQGGLQPTVDLDSVPEGLRALLVLEFDDVEFQDGLSRLADCGSIGI